MSDNKKQMMDIQKVKSFSVAVSDEHQRNWGDNLFSRKENDPKYNYDRSRTRLNFQVSKGGELGPVDKSKSITEKIDQAIKNRVTGRVNATSNRAVSLVFGGNREQMRKLAFGDQPISENGNNWDVDSCSGIDRWAKDIYDFCCREFGEENVVSFIVHLDELNPHAHAVIVPITKDGRLSAKDMFGGNDMNQARTRMRELHSRLAEVNGCADVVCVSSYRTVSLYANFLSMGQTGIAKRTESISISLACITFHSLFKGISYKRPLGYMLLE